MIPTGGQINWVWRLILGRAVDRVCCQHYPGTAALNLPVLIRELYTVTRSDKKQWRFSHSRLLQFEMCLKVMSYRSIWGRYGVDMGCKQ